MAYPNVTDRNFTIGPEVLFEHVNEVTNQWFTNMILLGIYVIILMGVFRYDKDLFNGFAIAGFVTFVITLGFWLAGIANATALVTSIAAVIFGFAALTLSKKAAR